MTEGIQYILYNLPEEQGEVQVVVKNETIWCTQKAMSQLFGVGVPAISKHLKNIFDEGELMQDATVSKMEIVVNRGFRGEVKEAVDFYQCPRCRRNQRLKVNMTSSIVLKRLTPILTRKSNC